MVQQDSDSKTTGTGTAETAAPTPSINPMQILARMVRLTGTRLRSQRATAYMGRRIGKSPEYDFEAKYEPMGEHQTPRHCYVHPDNPATHWELNTHDQSYRRPVCAGCAD